MEKFVPTTKLVPVEFDPFNGPELVCTIPTTEPQREVWIASCMGIEASCAYIESVTLELIGALDVDLLERSIAMVSDHHEAMRSVLSSDGMRMIVMRQMTIPFDRSDLRDMEDAQREIALDRIAVRDNTIPFDLLNGPFFRTHLVGISPEDHLLRISAHHVMCDGWSMGVVMADIARAYNGLATGITPQLSAQQRFSDYAIAQIDHMRGPGHEEVERYWLDLFKGPLPRIELPTDRQRPTHKTYNGDRIDLDLDKELVTGLRELGTRTGSSFVTTLLTAFELWLFKTTGDSDVCVGLPAAGQSDLGMKDLVGHCVNLLALRSSMDEEKTFLDHLRSRRSELLDAFDHQRYTFGTLVRRLNVPRDPGRVPLVPVVFNIDMNIDDEVNFHGLTHRFISNPRRYENFELFLNATGNNEKITLEWSYNTDLFNAATVRSWMEQFTTLIGRILYAPEAIMADLISEEPLLTGRSLPISEWQGTRIAYGSDKSISEAFLETVSRYPDHIALVHKEQRLTYTHLEKLVSALAIRLHGEGARPGDLIGLCCERDIGMVAAQMAILRVGAAFVPMDPSYPKERLRFLFQDTHVNMVLIDPSLTDDLPDHDAKVLAIPHLEDLSLPVDPYVPKDDPEGAAYIMYTSGSTGIPKGVVVPQRAIMRLVKNQNYASFGPGSVIAQISNISFDASTFEVWGALLNGGKLVLQEHRKANLREICDSIEKHGVNMMFITTGLFNVMVDEQLDKLRELKCILIGGEVMSVPHARKALRAIGPGVLKNIYGPTENTTFSCFHSIDSGSDIGRQVPIGKPIHNTFLYVLDETMRPVPVGVKGELYCGGDGVALGYWERPELNAERFLPDPFQGDGSRMYRTGDVVKWLPNGSLEFMGRTDDQVKVRGFRVELGEIESAISSLPGVRDRVVVLRRDLPGDQQLVAYVVPEEFDPTIDKERRDSFILMLRGDLAKHLPAYMLPSFTVALRELPLNANGKVDKGALPPPDLRINPLRAQHVAPRDGTERAVAAIWCKALGVQDIGVHDNFFDIGGHSLIGIQLLSQIERKYNKSLSLRSLFEAPTIAGFAELLEEDQPHLPWTNLSLVQPLGGLTPLFCVHGDEANHFIPRYLGNDRPFYGFFHQGEDGRELKYDTVPSIAEHFVDELRDARPHGPYLLCGYSFGGIVAYEMAQRLVEAGEQVPLLVLFDTYAPGLHQQAVRSDAKFYDPLKKMIFRSIVDRMLSHGRVLPPKLRHFHIIDTYDRAVLAYEPKPFAGKLIMFKAEGSWGPSDMGWKSIASGDMELHTLPGDHSDLIKEPHVKRLVQELAGCIRTAEQRKAAEAG